MHKASKALKKVQDDLCHFGLSLKIFDAYRSQRAVDHFVRWAGVRKNAQGRLRCVSCANEQLLLLQLAVNSASAQ
ncbi:MAG: hypothetical protein ACQER7_08115 [Bacteroidota bacterium]